MAPPLPGAVFWNKMHGLISELGPDGVAVGVPVYAAGKWGNGLNPTGTKHIMFNGAYPDGTRHLFGFQWKPKNNHDVVAQSIPFDARNAGNTHRINLVTNTLPHYTLRVVVYTGSTKVHYRYMSEYDGGTIYHVLVELDSGAGAGNRCKLYLADALQTPSSIVTDLAFNTDVLNVRNQHPSLGDTVGVADNMKLYNNLGVAADIIANNNNEGWPSVAKLALSNKLNRVEGVLAA